MAGCEPVSIGGDPNWGLKRILLGWGGLGATLGAASGLSAAALGGLALGAGAAFGVGVAGAAAGYVLGAAVGAAIDWFTRLKGQNPSTVTISGLIFCAGKNTGWPPVNDNDWTFNVGCLTVTDPTTLSVDELRTRPAPGGYPAYPTVDEGTRAPILHCEIGSHIGDFAAVGGAVGAIGGGIAGGLIGAAVGCAVLGVFTFGLGCLIAILVGIAIGAAVGYVVGDSLGAALGWLADQLSDFDRRGKSIEKNCMMFITGSWVNDTGHQHNEIHDIDRAVLIECGISSCPVGAVFAGVVGIGRHPQGPDP